MVRSIKSGTTSYHFFLEGVEADAIIKLANALDDIGQRGVSPFGTAANKLDEQMAQQNRDWEVCDQCGGTGWVEDES